MKYNLLAGKENKTTGGVGHDIRIWSTSINIKFLKGYLVVPSVECIIRQVAD